MKLQVHDTVVPLGDRHIKPNQPLPLRKQRITGIQKCSDKDKECPSDCPGLISLDCKEFKCYAFESTYPEDLKKGAHKLVIKKIGHHEPFDWREYNAIYD